jgi:hypothetical protein
VLYGFSLYLVIGLSVAAAFVSIGLSAVVARPATWPARLLILPGAALLWPYVLWRWRKAVDVKAGDA